MGYVLEDALGNIARCIINRLKTVSGEWFYVLNVELVFGEKLGYVLNAVVNGFVNLLDIIDANTELYMTNMTL